MASGIVPSPSLNTDWVLSTSSNAHICKDPAWFINYEPFSSYVEGVIGGGKLKVIGIGDAIVPVKIHPKRTGSAAHGTLVFHDVLHVPDAQCNIIGFARQSLPFESATFGSGGALYNAEGHRLATIRHAKPATLPALVLSGPPYGPGHCASSFQEGVDYVLTVVWPPGEEDRWSQYKAELKKGPLSGGAGESKGASTLGTPYTTEELAWLKQHFGDEKEFLKVASLDIEEEGERDVGRQIVHDLRMKILPKLENLREGSSDTQADGINVADIVKEMMAELNSGLFDEEELDFLNTEFGGHQSFMDEQGLSYSDPEDRVDAKTIVRCLMSMSDEDDDEFWCSGDEKEVAPQVGPSDYFFSTKELNFMRREGGSTENFMLMHGLKFYKDEDCDEAKAIIRALRSM